MVLSGVLDESYVYTSWVRPAVVSADAGDENSSGLKTTNNIPIDAAIVRSFFNQSP